VTEVPAGNDDFAERLDAVLEAVRGELRAKYEAREKAIPLCREAIRNSANGIRAVHRGESERAAALIDAAGTAIRSASAALAAYPDIYWAGSVHDAQKEFAEASILAAVVAGQGVPAPSALAVEPAAFLNGLAEAAGELRRHLLDRLRAGDVAYSERCLEWMDDIYSQLATVDFPDAMTGGLRRTTDMVRGVLEKSRGDLTAAVRQQALERRLGELESRLE
jgi:translin